MTKRFLSCARLFVALLALAAPAWAAVDDPADEAAVAATPQDADRDHACLDCHGEDGDTVSFADGSERSVFVDPATYRASVHAGRIGCTGCHRTVRDHPHPAVSAGSSRAYTLDQAGSCRRCHYAYFTRVKDSSHHRLLQKGRTDAPTCVDCHGAHGMTDPKPRGAMDAACQRCHAKLFDAYRTSVHGKGLPIGEQGGTRSADLPGCTDCHGAHAIADPKQPDVRAASYQICANCHGDEKRMARHGLSTRVLTTYLQDFHGASNRLYAMGAGTPETPIATCADCHGIHDVKSSRPQPGQAAASTDDARRRVVTSCRKCHEEVPDGFADAWLSHHEPSLQRTPLVWGVKVAYSVLIPFILLGLVVHILLHLWRVRTGR